MERALFLRRRPGGTARYLGSCNGRRDGRGPRSRQPRARSKPGRAHRNAAFHRRRGAAGDDPPARTASGRSRQRRVSHGQRAACGHRRSSQVHAQRRRPRGFSPRSTAHRTGDGAVDAGRQPSPSSSGSASDPQRRAAAARAARPAARPGRRAGAHLRRVAASGHSCAHPRADGIGWLVRVLAATHYRAGCDPSGSDRRGRSARAERSAHRRDGDARLRGAGRRRRQRRGAAHHHRSSAYGRRQRPQGRLGRRRRHPPAPHHNDHPHHRAGADAIGIRHRRRGATAGADGDHHHRRHRRFHGRLAARIAVSVFAARQRPAPPRCSSRHPHRTKRDGTPQSPQAGRSSAS